MIVYLIILSNFSIMTFNKHIAEDMPSLFNILDYNSQSSSDYRVELNSITAPALSCSVVSPNSIVFSFVYVAVKN